MFINIVINGFKYELLQQKTENYNLLRELSSLSCINFIYIYKLIMFKNQEIGTDDIGNQETG